MMGGGYEGGDKGHVRNLHLPLNVNLTCSIEQS